MGDFDDLIPQAQPQQAVGGFDDLVPQAPDFGNVQAQPSFGDVQGGAVSQSQLPTFAHDKGMQLDFSPKGALAQIGARMFDSTAMAEAGANMITGMFTPPVQGVGAVGAGLNALYSGETPDYAGVESKIGQVLNYQPETEGGKLLAEAANYPFQKLGEYGQSTGSDILAATGSPLLAAVAETAITAAPMFLDKVGAKADLEVSRGTDTAHALIDAAEQQVAKDTQGISDVGPAPPLDTAATTSAGEAQTLPAGAPVPETPAQVLGNERGPESTPPSQPSAEHAEPDVLSHDDIDALVQAGQVSPETAEQLKRMTSREPTTEAQEDYRTIGGSVPESTWTDSTVAKDAEGQPATLYRGSRSGTVSPDAFEQLGAATGHPSAQLGVFFTDDAADAGRYGQVGEFHLDLRNPKVYDAADFPGFDTPEEAKTLRQSLEQQGHDGIVMDATAYGGPKQYITFDKDQVIVPKEAENASHVREDQGLAGEVGQAAEGREVGGGGDLQQARRGEGDTHPEQLRQGGEVGRHVETDPVTFDRVYGDGAHAEFSQRPELYQRMAAIANHMDEVPKAQATVFRAAVTDMQQASPKRLQSALDHTIAQQAIPHEEPIQFPRELPARRIAGEPAAGQRAAPEMARTSAGIQGHEGGRATATEPRPPTQPPSGVGGGDEGGPPHPGLPANKAPNFQYVKDALANLGNKAADRTLRDVGRRSARAAWADAARSNVRAADAVETAGAHFDRRPAEVRADPTKAMEPVIQYQKGGIGAVTDPMARTVFGQMEKLLNEQVADIRSFGKGHLDELRDNYFRQEWEAPEGSKPNVTGIGRRPLGGNKSFTKERTFDTFEDGIKAGYKPKYDNPADYFLSRYTAGEKLKAALQIGKDLEDRGMVRPLANDERVPTGWARVNDNAFNGKVVPELVAKDLNNHLSPGFNQYAGWRTFRAIQNRLISARLGLSFFHAGLTTLDTLYTHASIGLQRVARGDLVGGFKELASTLVSPVMSPWKGKQLFDQYYGRTASDPQTAAILDLMQRGGARGRMTEAHAIHPEFNDDYTALKKALRRGEWGKASLKTLPALIESVSRPMLNYLVPYQKMISRGLLLKFELDRVAGKLGQTKGDYASIIKAAHPDYLDEIAQRVDRDVSNRLGQHTYENYFWNRPVRDMLHAGVTSVGWNLGSLEFNAGGLADVRRIVAPEKLAMPLDVEGKIPAQMSRVTTRAAYLATMAAIHFSFAAGLMYAMTGQKPTEGKDLFYPKTGRKNGDGTDERLTLPDFMRDMWEGSHHPMQMAENKLQPTWNILTELLHNKDYYGNEIVNPDANVPKMAKEAITYLGKSFLPYSVTGQQKLAQAGAPIAERVLPFVGVTPSPGAVTRSAFLDYVHEHKAPHGGEMTPEQSDHLQSLYAAADAIKQGQKVDLTPFSGPDRIKINRYSKSTPYASSVKDLNYSQLKHAYDLATPEERRTFKLDALLRSKRAKASQDELE